MQSTRTLPTHRYIKKTKEENKKTPNKQQNLPLIHEIEAREHSLQRLSVLTWCQEVENLHGKGASKSKNVRKTPGQS